MRRQKFIRAVIGQSVGYMERCPVYHRTQSCCFLLFFFYIFQITISAFNAAMYSNN